MTLSTPKQRIRACRTRRAALFAATFALSSVGALALPRPSAADDWGSFDKNFVDPPQSAQPQTWWHWLNGNVTKEGITADLEAMKRVGVGGAEILNVDQGIPLGKSPMMSPSWFEMVHFAESEAARLGLDLEVHNGGGWSSSGGPWITPEISMLQVVNSSQSVAGGAHFSGKLPTPPNQRNFYREIAVIAVPAAPEGAAPAGIPDLRVKGDWDHGGNIGIGTGDHAPSHTDFARADEIDLTKNLTADGELDWTAPAGHDWVILRFGYTTTGAQNEPSPAAGLGLECDKLSKAALDIHFAGMVQKILDQAGPLAGKNGALNGVLIDSYEVGMQNWTPAFREEFRKRRGYDLTPYLPVLANHVVDSPEVSERFLWDFRRTITDLFTENYYGHFAELCHARGLKFSTEAYGNGPFDGLACGGQADIPMAEFWVGGAAEDTAKLASSSGHTYGRKYVSTESFTSEPSHEKGTVAPYDLKSQGDRMYCAGINRFIFHRYAMQPWIDRAPGMTMGPWGIHFERTNTIWNQSAAWLKYLGRCQYILQQGTFVADVAYYNGDNTPFDSVIRDSSLPAGYDYDGLSRDLLLHQLSVKDGMLALPSGMRYRVLVLPHSTTMSVETLRKIRDLVANGATVVGPKPDKSPSLQNYPACDKDVAILADELWGPIDGATTTEHEYKKGRVFWSADRDVLARVFNEEKVAPDFTATQVTSATRHPAAGVSFIHHVDSDRETYFVASRWGTSRDIEASFRVGENEVPFLYHADSGKIERAPVGSRRGDRTYIPLHFDPSGSVFVVFNPIAPAGDAAQPVASAISAKFTPTGGETVAPVQTLIINHAVYEAVDGAGTPADVTDRVAAQVEGGSILMQTSNDALGGDPIFNHVKRLRVSYTLNGVPGTVDVDENGTLQISSASGQNGPPSARFHTNNSGNIEAEVWQSGTVSVASASGKTLSATATVPAPLAIDGSWSLAFPPNLGAPATAVLNSLASWSDNTDPGIKYFSGTATYTKDIDISADLLGAGKGLYLDLGEIKNIAQVKLNGNDLGILWKPPYRVNLATAAHAGANHLEIAVTNLWPNRLIGDEQLPEDADWDGDHLRSWPQWLLDDKPRPSGRIAFTTWKHWKKEDPLFPAGLLGPVRLLPSVTVEVK